MVIYVVQPGDTIYSIADSYGISPSLLSSLNGFTTDRLAVGQNIVIVYPDEVYTVQSGDTLLSVAEKLGVSVNQILRNNPILNGTDAIFEGQTLIISYAEEKKGRMAVGGYIYPFVSIDTLRKTLPYLSFITLFTYGFTSDGKIVEEGVNGYDFSDDELISLAKEYGVAPFMHLSTLTIDGSFSSEKANELLDNNEAQEVLIDNIISFMREKGYYGLDIDFEYVSPKDKNAYSDFIGKVQNALSQNGFPLITALAPKTSSTQPGLLYEAHDYNAIGRNSDYVLLMTYEWGYTYGPPMAVAPINKVKQVVDYALTETEAGKIYLGVPNYSYDWTLPYIRGESKAEKISNVSAVNRAVVFGSDIMFDEVAQTPYYYYSNNGKEHVVWFEDARSINEKLSLVPSYGLKGAVYWNLMDYFPQSWLVLNTQYDIEKFI